MELLVRTRNPRPWRCKASMKSGPPGTACSSCTRTPSMSLSQQETGFGSVTLSFWRTLGCDDMGTDGRPSAGRGSGDERLRRPVLLGGSTLIGSAGILAEDDLTVAIDSFTNTSSQDPSSRDGRPDDPLPRLR